MRNRNFRRNLLCMKQKAIILIIIIIIIIIIIRVRKRTALFPKRKNVV